jgi:hypothetical protein
LENIDGAYGLVIYNGQEESLSIISDPMGQFSVFLGSRQSQTLISTSAIAVAKQTCAQPDDLTLESFLRTGKVLGDKTFWRGVKRFLPAKVCKFYRDKIEEIEYFAPTYDESISKLCIDEALEQSSDILTFTFDRLLRREGRVWADLTGGFDTRLTTILMAKIGIPFITYCVGPSDHPDVQISKQVSEEMGWEFWHMPMPDNWAQEQLNWLEIALYKGDARLGVAGLAGVLWGQQERSIKCKASVGGVGADEWREAAYLGTLPYVWGKEYPYDRLIDAGILSPIPKSVMRQDRENQIRDDLKAYLKILVPDYARFSNVVKGHFMFIRFRYPAHGGSYLSAASGIIRSLSPFCFKEPVNFALSLNYKWRLQYHYHFVRRLLEKENPCMANIETDRGGPAIPIRVTNLYRFSPLYKSLINRFVGRASRGLFGRSVELWPRPYHSSYPLLSWKISLMNYVGSTDLLNLSYMRSGVLYKSEEMQYFIASQKNNQFRNFEFLDRVISIEMAMRAADSWVE